MKYLKPRIQLIQHRKFAPNWCSVIQNHQSSNLIFSSIFDCTTLLALAIGIGK